jgi:hypothetical protein
MWGIFHISPYSFSLEDNSFPLKHPFHDDSFTPLLIITFFPAAVSKRLSIGGKDLNRSERN